MDFALSPEQALLKRELERFAKEEIAALAEEAERGDGFDEYPVHLFTRMGALGYLCVSYPEEYGGAGMDVVAGCLHAEIMGRYGGVGLGGAFMVQAGIGTHLILDYGSEEQKQRFLVPATRGEKIGAFGLTEPEAGSDASAMRTTAVRKGDRYVLNGSKIFITNGTIADFVCVAAYTDRSQGARGGVSILVVEKGSPGFEARQVAKHVAKSADTGELFFEDCEVPAENLVGEEGKGFSYLMAVLDAGRVTHGARSVGVAQSAYDRAAAYAPERVQFGRPFSKFQAVRFKLAEMATEIEAARWLVYHAAWSLDRGLADAKGKAAMAKLFASEVAQRAASEAMQILGGYGITKDYTLFPIFAGARLATVTEGTSEIQKLVIARELGF